MSQEYRSLHPLMPLRFGLPSSPSASSTSRRLKRNRPISDAPPPPPSRTPTRQEKAGPSTARMSTTQADAALKGGAELEGEAEPSTPQYSSRPPSYSHLTSPVDNPMGEAEEPLFTRQEDEAPEASRSQESGQKKKKIARTSIKTSVRVLQSRAKERCAQIFIKFVSEGVCLRLVIFNYQICVPETS